MLEPPMFTAPDPDTQPSPQPAPPTDGAAPSPAPAAGGVNFYTPPPAAPAYPTLEQAPRYKPGGGGRGGADPDITAIRQASNASSAAQNRAGDIEAEQGKQVGQQYADQASYMAERSKARDTLAGEISNQYDQQLKDYGDSVKDYMNSKVDPNHFWNSQSTGSQIGLILAQAMGGFANGFSGGKIPNAAADMIKSRIENDIRAQQTNMEQKGKGLEVKRNLISMAREHGVDKEHEFDLATAAAKDQTADRILAMQTTFGGQASQAGKQAIAAQLKQSAAQDIAKIRNEKQGQAIQQAELGIKQHEVQTQDTDRANQLKLQKHQSDVMQQFMGGGSGGSDDAANYLRASNPDLGKRLAHLGPGQNTLVASEDEKKDLEDTLNNVEAAKKKVSAMREIVNKHGSFTIPGVDADARAEGADLQTGLARDLTAMAGVAGKVSPKLEELGGGKDVVNPASMGTIAGKLAYYDALTKKLDAAKEDIGNKYGLKLRSKPSSFKGAGE